MTGNTRSTLGRVCIVTALASIAAVHLWTTAPARVRGATRLDGIPPSLDSMPRHPWPRDTARRDTAQRDTAWRDTTWRDSLPDTARRHPPRRPHRPLG